MSRAMAARRNQGVPVAAALQEDLTMWGHTHDKEKAFQEAKLKKRKVEALTAGALIDGEIDDEVVDLAAQRRVKAASLRAAAKRKAQKVAAQLRGGALPALDTLRGKRVFVDVGGHLPPKDSKTMDEVTLYWVSKWTLPLWSIILLRSK